MGRNGHRCVLLENFQEQVWQWVRMLYREAIKWKRFHSAGVISKHDLIRLWNSRSNFQCWRFSCLSYRYSYKHLHSIFIHCFHHVKRDLSKFSLPKQIFRQDHSSLSGLFIQNHLKAIALKSPNRSSDKTIVLLMAYSFKAYSRIHRSQIPKPLGQDPRRYIFSFTQFPLVINLLSRNFHSLSVFLLLAHKL